VIHADERLARRLEAILVEEWGRLAETTRALWPEKKATYLDVAGGRALWLGEGSLVNVAAGLAMGGPIGEAELRKVEDFYARRGATPILATCPFADPTLFALLGRRGWWITEFENVLALELGGEADACSPEGREAAGVATAGPAAGAPPGPVLAPTAPAVPRPGLAPGVEVRVCAGEERELWGAIAAQAFNDDADVSLAHEEFGRLMAVRPDRILVMGWVDGRPVATGGLVIYGDIAWLMGDATLSAYRRRGLQQAIQRERLRLAREAGCALAVTESVPGSGSQRNMERLGFRLVYNHLEFARI
jgi:hypothetical protein